MKLNKVATGMVCAGVFKTLDLRPLHAQHAPIKQGGARSTSNYPSVETQEKIWDAAIAKRLRKQQARIIAAGGSINETL